MVLKSISVRESLPDFEYAYITQNLLELARLYKSRDEFNKANALFERSIPLLEQLKIRETDPIGYADMLEDYVYTLNGANSEKAMEIADTIARLRVNNPGVRRNFVAIQYPYNCN